MFWAASRVDLVWAAWCRGCDGVGAIIAERSYSLRTIDLRKDCDIIHIDVVFREGLELGLWMRRQTRLLLSWTGSRRGGSRRLLMPGGLTTWRGWGSL